VPGDRGASGPDHATIARFVERHETALGELFGEVLRLCAAVGLASVGVVAIDGTKISANANRDRSMDYEQIARAIVEEAVATDAAENERFGGRRGDELPDTIPVGEGRRKWLAAARRRLDQERAVELRRSRARARSGSLTRRHDSTRSSLLSSKRTANTRTTGRKGAGVTGDGSRRHESPTRHPTSLPGRSI
jgi:hypothetical protein